MAEYHVGLDVSLDETSVCVVDQDGKVMKECKAATEPADIALAISTYADDVARVGLEAQSLSPWLYTELQALGLPRRPRHELRQARRSSPGDRIRPVSAFRSQSDARQLNHTDSVGKPRNAGCGRTVPGSKKRPGAPQRGAVALPGRPRFSPPGEYDHQTRKASPWFPSKQNRDAPRQHDNARYKNDPGGG